jgi:hypothetical protein
MRTETAPASQSPAWRNWTIRLLAAGALIAAGCGNPGEEITVISEDLFVEVMTRLVLIDVDPPPRPNQSAARAAADSLRTGLLGDYSLSADDLLLFADVVGQEPDSTPDRLDPRSGHSPPIPPAL